MRSAAFILIIAMATAFAALPGAQPGGAGVAGFTVNTTLDDPDNFLGDGFCDTGEGVCSLRAAVMELNAFGGTHTITLPAGTYSLSFGAAGEDVAGTGDLDLTADGLTINGAGSGTTFIQRGFGVHRVFELIGGSHTINGVTIRNGQGEAGVALNCHCGGAILLNGSSSLSLNNSQVTGSGATSDGGGIYVSSTASLSMFNVGVTGNTSSTNGGGIINFGETTINSSTIGGNIAGPNGGGIENEGTLIVTDSTISGNDSTSLGGGISISQLGGATITDSTIAGNDATNFGLGGGIRTRGGLTVTNSTISGNNASDGGAVSVIDPGIATISSSTITGNTFTGLLVSGTTNLRNTIVAANGGANCNVSGGMNSLGYNIDSGNTCGLVGTGDQINTDPDLGGLASNGGLTQTHALLVTSPAIDTANPAIVGSGADACPTMDQRGVTRPIDGDIVLGNRCDIGAYEFGDADADTIKDATETACGSNPGNALSVPERLDGAFAGTDDDGDTVVDDGLPPGSEAYDCDGDGFTGTAENYVYVAAGTARNQDPCGNNGWPLDLAGGTNRVDIVDLGSYIAPTRRLNTDPGDPGYNIRWDVKPGGIVKDIDIADLGAFFSSTSGFPPMFGSARAYNKTCPWAP